ncbi:ClpX C4-type zinc finger protein [Robertmurraya andreesenii]|nr:ClpX C4-type zinc finger protein [Robertmurraya andreesenii]
MSINLRVLVKLYTKVVYDIYPNRGGLCEVKTKDSQQIERQRFYEGMAIAYTTIALKLKGEFDYIEPKVIDELYNAVEKKHESKIHPDHVDTCSFCRRSKEEVGDLALGPGVSICRECLKFGEEIIKSN